MSQRKQVKTEERTEKNKQKKQFAWGATQPEAWEEH